LFEKYILDELEVWLQVTTLVTLQARAQSPQQFQAISVLSIRERGKYACVHVYREAAFMETLITEYSVKLVANESQCVTGELV